MRVRGEDMTNENADVEHASNEDGDGGVDGSGNNSGGDSSSDESIASSHSDTDGSESNDDGAGLDLHPGLLAFLSRQQDSVDHELSAVSDRLRGGGGDSNYSMHSPPLLRINLVRKYIYDNGAIQIARAMEEGCAGCSHHNVSRSSNAQESIGGSNANEIAGITHDTLPIISSPCQCPSQHLREIILSRCHIGDDGACTLAHALSNSFTPSLKTLDLSSNNITGVAVACLANCLVAGDLGSCGGFGSNIDTLVLSSNPILSMGANALANALKGRRSECLFHQKNLSDEASESTMHSSAGGFCSLKKLHVSGCQLNDEDAIVLGSSLLPGHSHSEPKICDKDSTNNLKLLNLHGNCITMKGMEFLYTVVHNSSSKPSNNNKIDGGSAQDCIQSLFSQSNHTIELGVIADYGTRDYNYGHFFDQEEDEQILADMKQYEIIGTEPFGIEQLKALMVEKWILKENMMHSLQINQHCSSALEHVSASSPDEMNTMPNLSHDEQGKRKQILWAGARKKIAHLLEEMLHPSPISLPRRQDEYGKYIDNNNRPHVSQCVRPVAPTIGKHFTKYNSNVIPQILCWINHHFHHPTALAMAFDILRDNPDICGFHSLLFDSAC